MCWFVLCRKVMYPFDNEIKWQVYYAQRTAVAQWLRCCATNWKVTGSILDGVIGIYHWNKILSIVLWSWGRISLWQNWVPGAFPGGKGGRCVTLTTLPPSGAVVMKSGNLNFLEPSEHLGPVMGLHYAQGRNLGQRIQFFHACSQIQHDSMFSFRFN